MPFDPEHLPNRVDLHVGGRVRMRRKFLGMSQESLAESIELTFQQVQKYERASNRISASKLYEIATALKVTVGYFFEGLDDAPGAEMVSGSESSVNAFLCTTEGIALAQTFPNIRGARTRRKLLELVTTLSEDGAE